MGSLVAELAEKLSSATNNFDIDEGTIYVNTSADTVGIGTTSPGSKFDVQGTMQVGVNDTGHDVKFFGATAGAYLEWDESADELELRGGAATPGKLLLSTAETTVVDGNKLGQIDFQAPLDSAGTDAILVGASIYAEADATFSSSVNATELVFATGASETATEKMRITSDGKVGIGTTAPAQLLDIVSATTTKIRMENTGDAGTTIIMDADRSAEDGGLGSIVFYWNGTAVASFGGQSGPDTGNKDDGKLIFSTATSGGSRQTRMTIDDTGRVGIGSTSPGFQLDLQNTGADGMRVAGYSTTASDAGRLYLTHSNNGTVGTQTAVDAEDVLGQIIFQGSNGSAFVTGASIQAIADETFSGTAQGSYLSFFTVDNTTTGLDERMRIDHNGRVGIGTTAPSGSRLEVRANSGGTSSSDCLVAITNGDDGTFNDALLNVKNAGNRGAINHASGSPLVEFEYSDATAFIIDKDGNVGINTNDPKYQLDIPRSSPYGDATVAASGTSNGASMSGNLYKLFYTTTFVTAKYLHNISTSQTANLRIRVYVNNLYGTEFTIFATGWHYQNGAQTAVNQRTFMIQLEGTTNRGSEDAYRHSNLTGGTAPSNLAIGAQSAGNVSLYTDVTVTIATNWYCHLGLTARGANVNANVFNSISYI